MTSFNRFLFLIVAFLNTYLVSAQIVSCDNLPFEELNFYDNITYKNEKGKTVFVEEFAHLENIVIESIYYKSDSLKIKGFIMRPKEIKRFPLIIFNRGGNRTYGELTPNILVYNLSYLVSKGYTVAGSTYRGSKFSEGEDEFGGNDINDVVELIKCLKKESYIDSNKLALYGWSRGGIMTYKTLQRIGGNSGIKTAIVGGAPSNLIETIIERPEMESKVFSKIIPNYENDKEYLLKERSVIFWVNELPKIPIMLIHGLKDDAVSVNQTIKLSTKFLENDIPFKLIIFEDEKHNIYTNKKELDIVIENWLSKYL